MNDKNLPTFDELPEFKGKPGCAWEVWGKDDQLGTINLLTPDVVKRAMTEEIQTGKTVSLSWPINFPKKALFFRESADITLKAIPTLAKGDDVIHMNSQAGSQWDGMRHYGLFEDHIFYNNTPRDAIPFGKIEIADPANIDPAYVKLGIHNWAEHGICGRGVLLDLVEHYTHDGSPLPYNPWESHSFTVEELKACAAKEGVEFRHGDILLIRGGFIKKYYEETDEARDLLAAPKRNPPFQFAGIDPSIEMKRFIWNNHFAAAASDQPTLEVAPVEATVSLSAYTRADAEAALAAEGAGLLDARDHAKVRDDAITVTVRLEVASSLWGMPIGELFDLEALSKQCKETGRYSFFFSSWPLKIIGGCAAPPNAAAYF